MGSRLLYYFTSLFTLLRGVQNWWQLPLLLTGKRPFLLKLRSGLRFWVRSLMDVWIIKETCLDRDYEQHGAPLQDGWTVIDIGAGLGDFALYAAYGRPQTAVLALEPFPESFDLLGRNLQLNQIGQVTPLPLAVGKQSGTLTLATVGAAVQHTTAQETAAAPLPGAGVDQTLTVQGISLDDLFAQQEIERCHFMKVDCEGAEFDIFFHASDDTLDRIERIALEVHEGVTPHKAADLAKFFRHKGFQVRTTPNPVHRSLSFMVAQRALIYHMVPQAEWQTAVSAGLYRPDSLTSEGFIHCSTVAQLLIPANSLYKGRTDLILLEIDPNRLTERLLFEDCYQSGVAFPHIYGPLSPTAVLRTIPFPPQPDGLFTLPPQLRKG